MAVFTSGLRIAVAVLLLLTSTLLLQGCGGGSNNVEGADVPKPMGLEVGPGKGGQSIPSNTWECTVHKPMAASHVWTIPATKLSPLVKGQPLQSESFRLPPFPGDFTIYYFPQGETKATDGYCTAFVSSSASMTAKLEMSVNEKSQVYNIGLLRAGGTLGWTDFATATAGGVTLSMGLKEVTRDNTTTMDPDVVTRKVFDANNTLAKVFTYSCWRYALSDTPDVSWLQEEERQIGTQTCTNEAIRDAQKKAWESEGITGSQAECEGNDIVLTRKKTAKCTVPFLKSQHCSKPSAFLQHRRGQKHVGLVAD